MSFPVAKFFFPTEQVAIHTNILFDTVHIHMGVIFIHVAIELMDS